MINFLFALLSSPAQACQLTKPGVLKIGCSIECGASYKSALQNAAIENGYSIEIVSITPGANVSAQLAQLDGVLSPGGHDIDPKYFTKKVSPAQRARLEDQHRRLGNDGEHDPKNDARDKHEYELMQTYFKDPKFNNMPLLGVCYGMQMMAAVNDVPLYVDITEELGLPAQRGVHNRIQFTSMEKGRLKALPDSFEAYKWHHQAVNAEAISANPQLYRNIKVHAKSNGGRIAEIMEITDRPAIGVQFHAESDRQQDRKISTAVYGWFLRQACANRNFKTQPVLTPAKTAPPKSPPSNSGGSVMMIQ